VRQDDPLAALRDESKLEFYEIENRSQEVIVDSGKRAKDLRKQLNKTYIKSVKERI